MRVLVTWGSKRGGTEGIAQIVGAALAAAGHEPVLLPAAKVHREDGFDAVIVGGALYANRWHADARRFVWRHRKALRKVPVWFFSSGPLDELGGCGEIPSHRKGAGARRAGRGAGACDVRGSPLGRRARLSGERDGEDPRR